MEETAFPRAAQMNTQRKPKAIAMLIGVLILLALLVYGGTRFFGTGSNAPDEEGEVLPTAVIEPTEPQEPTDTEDVVSPTDTEDDKEITPTTAANLKLDKSSLAIQVLNGSGISGQAGKVQATLEGLGYTDVTTGNADSFDYEDLSISVKSTKANYLKALETDLSDSYTIGDTDTKLSSSEYDVVIIIGE